MNWCLTAGQKKPSHSHTTHTIIAALETRFCGMAPSLSLCLTCSIIAAMVYLVFVRVGFVHTIQISGILHTPSVRVYLRNLLKIVCVCSDLQCDDSDDSGAAGELKATTLQIIRLNGRFEMVIKYDLHVTQNCITPMIRNNIKFTHIFVAFILYIFSKAEVYDADFVCLCVCKYSMYWSCLVG